MMVSRSASFLAALGLALLSYSTTIAQNVFIDKGEGVCVDFSSVQYDYIEFADVASAAECQSTCTSLDGTYLRGIEYEASSQRCLCLYENGAPYPINAFSEVGEDLGSGAIAGANATFSTFECYKYSEGSFSLLGNGGCIDASNEFYSFATPVSAQGTQTAADCQSACVASGTSYDLVGLDYNGECFCLYSNGRAPVVAAAAVNFSKRGSGPIAGTSTFAGVICQSFGPPPTPVPTPAPTLAPVTVGGNRDGAVATTPVAEKAPTTRGGGSSSGGKAPKIKAVKAPTVDTTRGTKLSTGSAPVSTPVSVPIVVPKGTKRRARR